MDSDDKKRLKVEISKIEALVDKLYIDSIRKHAMALQEKQAFEATLQQVILGQLKTVENSLQFIRHVLLGS